MAAIQAISEVFPNVQISGCYFHYTQCLWRKLQELGLQPAYEDEDPTFKIQAKSFAGLALVPIEVFLQYFYTYLNEQILCKIMRPIYS